MRIDLPYPHKALWPNGRAHWGEKAREAKKHRAWAKLATMEVRATNIALNGPVPVTIRIHPKRYGPVPDADNIIAASKSMLDGIADALGLNDRDFAAPKVSIGPREGRFVVEIG